MNALAQRLGIDFPLIQAGMGGIAGPALAAATAEAGAAGVLALYRSPPALIGSLLLQTCRLTGRPFGVNLIPELVTREALHAQIDATLAASGAHVFFTFFGLPDPQSCTLLQQAGRAFLIMVGDVAALHAAAALGADAVILQGTEAGGHLLGAQRLDTLLAAALGSGCTVPLIAAGGIGNGHRWHELAALGVAGCLCGTLFTATAESLAHPHFKQRLVDAAPQDTVVTDRFDIGWPARRHRVLRNALTEASQPLKPPAFIATVAAAGRRHPLPRYSAMVPSVHTEGRIDEMALYCGESVAGVRDIPSVRQRVETFIGEFRSTALAHSADTGDRGPAGA